MGGRAGGYFTPPARPLIDAITAVQRPPRLSGASGKWDATSLNLERSRGAAIAGPANGRMAQLGQSEHGAAGTVFWRTADHADALS